MNLSFDFLIQVAASVAPILDLLEISLAAWIELDRKVFESSWIVTGYFDPDHFQQYRGTEDGISTQEEAEHLADPSEVLEGSSLTQTPQYCTKYEWQLEDYGFQVGVYKHGTQKERINSNY